MLLFSKLKEPVFLKESNTAKVQLEQLQYLLEKATGEVKSEIEQDIKLLSYGIYGEETIEFELKHSHIPMFILHDLFLSDNGLTAQIDYLIITRKLVFVIECKNLLGNIEITSNGDFIRTVNFNGRYRKEGIYSPITQNQRHLALLKQLRGKTKSNFISKALFEKYFDKNYDAVVVLANPKAVLNAKFAKKETKNKVIRADQLISYINEKNSKSALDSSSDAQMEELANFYLSLHSENTTDYIQKYKAKIDNGESADKNFICTTPTPINQRQDETDNQALIKELKTYRLLKSREENVKPYFIFNDNQLNDLIKVMPKSICELITVSGFGEVKCKKYGNDIIAIIRRY